MHIPAFRSRLAWLPVLLPVIAFVVLGAVRPSAAQVPATEQKPRVVYVVINAPATETIEEIKYKFEQAKGRTDGKFNCDGIIVEPVAAEVFGLLNSIVKRGAEAVRELRVMGEREGIECLVGNPNAWVVNLGKAAMTKTAKIDIAGSGKGDDLAVTKPLEVEVGKSASDADVVLLGHSPGRYVVRTKADVRPVKFRCTATDLSGVERDFEAEFPAADSGIVYLVTLNGVKGDTEPLFATLSDGAKVANPILEMNDVPLIVANFVPQPVVVPDSFEFVDGTLRFIQPVDKAIYPRRLWLFFAATKAEREAERQRLTARPFTEIPGLIRQNRANLAKPASALNAKGGWVEVAPLLKDPTTGQKSFQVGVRFDLPAWKQAIEKPATEASDEILMVYEFENEEDKEPSPIKVGGLEYVVTKKLPDFVQAVKKAK